MQRKLRNLGELKMSIFRKPTRRRTLTPSNRRRRAQTTALKSKLDNQINAFNASRANRPTEKRKKDRGPSVDPRPSSMNKRRRQLERISKRVNESKLGQKIKKNVQKLRTVKNPVRQAKIQQRLKKQTGKAIQRMTKAQTKKGVPAGVARRA